VDPAVCPSDWSVKRDCGFGGIAEDECVRRGCCWDNHMSNDLQGVPQCYYSTAAAQDLVFLGHGLNFKQALYEYTLIAGKIPVPPRYQFGVFFSRYWAYADWEEYQLVQQYIDHQVPLDIMVVRIERNTAHAG